jgi:hypothetical protein
VVHQQKIAAGLAVAGLILLIVAAVSYRNGGGFTETSPIDTASVGVNRMQHNFETMQREIESRKVVEA